MAAESNPQPDNVSAFPRIVVHDLFRLAQHSDEVPWEPFKQGVDIHRLYGDGVSGPTAALLRFREASKIPLHMHPGFEHILVLAGNQRDQNGTTGPGTLTINPPGTTHSVVSDAGCIVLAVYTQAVQFIDKAQSGQLGSRAAGAHGRATSSPP